MPFLAFLCLKNITLPEYTTLNMTTPIFGVIISLLYLKEKMNHYIYISILMGIMGVILVIQPSFENFNFFYNFPILTKNHPIGIRVFYIIFNYYIL